MEEKKKKGRISKKPSFPFSPISFLSTTTLPTLVFPTFHQSPPSEKVCIPLACPWVGNLSKANDGKLDSAGAGKTPGNSFNLNGLKSINYETGPRRTGTMRRVARGGTCARPRVGVWVHFEGETSFCYRDRNDARYKFHSTGTIHFPRR